MTPISACRYPVGIQTFSEIINGGYVYVRTQVKCAGGRTDMVVYMPDTTYILELKVNASAQEALQQIKARNYALPYHTEGNGIVMVGIRFNADTRTIDDWVIE